MTRPLDSAIVIQFKRRSGPDKWPAPPAWQSLIDCYITAEQAVDRPETTISTRVSHISRIARALRTDPADVSGDTLKNWFATQKHWARETRRGYRNSASSFFSWAHTEGHLETNPAASLPLIKADRPTPRPAPDRVWAEAILAAEPRTALMLRLAAEAGLRRSEVAKVHTRDLIEGFDGPQLLVHGKGCRERVVPISCELADLIAAGAPGHTPELAAYGVEGWLFPGDDNGHLSPRWVGTLISEALPEHWTMHTLRHRFATRAYRGTRNIRAVQELLGHSSIATTQIYTAVDDEEMRAAMLAAAAPTPPRRGGGVVASVAAAITATVLTSVFGAGSSSDDSRQHATPPMHGVTVELVNADGNVANI
ncbi:tyrosine-type recombinase/integrase [Mycolicibacterium fortuitum]|uniref:tyrosine-type recombinase/integrase n=1 Tax=Mycolicibacterium fortuitum TaxID=1766 RepID=UPI0009C1A172|nr:tyrosine-type recombinase/integrase [Mycolicibacterium fortuitum]